MDRSFSSRLFTGAIILVASFCLIVATGRSQERPWKPSTERPSAPVDLCDYCLAYQGISPLEIGSSGLRADLRYLRLGSMYQGGSKALNPGQELESHLTQQYTFFFTLSPRLSFSTLVPLPKRHSERFEEDGTIVAGNQFGLGDISLLARYKPLVEHTMEATTILSLTAGVKLPTGKTNGRDTRGDLLDAHVQLGTGSTDILLGISGFAAMERLAFIANVLGAITSRGANGHQFGNSLNYDASVRYRIYPSDLGETQLFATLGVFGELRAREIQDGVVDDASGGNVIFLSPGLQVFLTPALSLDGTYQIPIVHALNGPQLGEDYRILVGLQVLAW